MKNEKQRVEAYVVYPHFFDFLTCKKKCNYIHKRRTTGHKKELST